MKNKPDRSKIEVTDKNGKENKKSKWPLYISIGIIAALLGCYFLWPSFKDFVNEAYQVLTSDNKSKISNWVSQFGFWGPLLIFAIMIVQMFLFVIPSTLVMIISILAYGPIWGSLLALTGLLISSSVAYAIGEHLGPVTVDKLIGQDTKNKVGKNVEKYGVWMVIIVRIAPLLSDDATSFVAGLVRMGYWRFIWSSIVGIVPLLIALAYLGEDFERLKTGFIWISVVSLVAFIIYVIYDQYKKKRKK